MSKGCWPRKAAGLFERRRLSWSTGRSWVDAAFDEELGDAHAVPPVLGSTAELGNTETAEVGEDESVLGLALLSGSGSVK